MPISLLSRNRSKSTARSQSHSSPKGNTLSKPPSSSSAAPSHRGRAVSISLGYPTATAQPMPMQMPMQMQMPPVPGQGMMGMGMGMTVHSPTGVPLVQMSLPPQHSYVTYAPYAPPGPTQITTLHSPPVLSPIPMARGPPPMSPPLTRYATPGTRTSVSSRSRGPPTTATTSSMTSRSMTSTATSSTSTSTSRPPTTATSPSTARSPPTVRPPSRAFTLASQPPMRSASTPPQRTSLPPSSAPFTSSVSPNAPAHPSTPIYHRPTTRFCPHCSARVPTDPYFKFCTACQRPLAAYPARPQSTVPAADGFQIPGLGGVPVASGLTGMRLRGGGGGAGGERDSAQGSKDRTRSPPVFSSAVGSPVGSSSPASSPIGSGSLGGYGGGREHVTAPSAVTMAASAAAAAAAEAEGGPGSTHPAGREALVLPNGRPTRKLEALRDALVDWLFRQVPTNSGLVDMSRTYALEWAWGRSDFLTLFNADTTQRLYNALGYEYASVTTEHPRDRAVVERTPALSRKGFLQLLTHELLLDPRGATARLRTLLARHAAAIPPPPADLRLDGGAGGRWKVEEWMVLRAPHPGAVQKQRRLVEMMRGLGWEIGQTVQ